MAFNQIPGTDLIVEVCDRCVSKIGYRLASEATTTREFVLQLMPGVWAICETCDEELDVCEDAEREP